MHAANTWSSTSTPLRSWGWRIVQHFINAAAVLVILVCLWLLLHQTESKYLSVFGLMAAMHPEFKIIISIPESKRRISYLRT
jgi:hypothetical protein